MKLLLLLWEIVYRKLIYPTLKLEYVPLAAVLTLSTTNRMSQTTAVSQTPVEYDVRFPLARSMIVSGPSCSGKSYFVAELLRDTEVYFVPRPKRIIWYYGEVAPQPVVKGIQYKKGLPTESDVNSFLQDIVVLDDLMWESRSNIQVGNLFTRVAHHRQCFIIQMTQNLFQSGSVTRTQSLNAHYFILFKNPRDRLQITHLARQIYPRQCDFFLSCFEDATRRDHGYLLVDLGPTTKEEMRLRSNILLADKQYVVYLPPAPQNDVYKTPSSHSTHSATDST